MKNLEIMDHEDDGLMTVASSSSPTTIVVSRSILFKYYAITLAFFVVSAGCVYVGATQGFSDDPENPDVPSAIVNVIRTAFVITIFALFLYATIAAAHFQVQVDSNGLSIQAISSLRSGRMNLFVSWDSLTGVQLWEHCGEHPKTGRRYSMIKKIVLILEQEEIEIKTEFWKWKMPSIQEDLERYLPKVTMVTGAMSPELVRVFCFAHAVLDENHPETAPSPDSLAHEDGRTRSAIKLKIRNLALRQLQRKAEGTICMLSILTVGCLFLVGIVIYRDVKKGPNGMSIVLLAMVLSVFVLFYRRMLLHRLKKEIEHLDQFTFCERRSDDRHCCTATLKSDQFIEIV